MGYGFTGCGFARSFAMNDRLLLSGFDRPATPDDLDGIFDAAAEAHLPAMVVFATLRDEDAVVAQLRALGAG